MKIFGPSLRAAALAMPPYLNQSPLQTPCFVLHFTPVYGVLGNILRYSCLCLLFTAFNGCVPRDYAVEHSLQNGEAGETFGYRTWKRDHLKQDVVIIGIHGFSGASNDYANLGNYLVKRQTNTAVYAYELRGQGSDPIQERRGDIGHPSQWYTDLNAFTQLVRKRHPKAKIIWYGESMGGLIATHSLHSAPAGNPPCDALILSSPIVRFRDDIELWKIALIQVAATTAPLARIPIDAFTGQEDIQVTQTTFYKEQSKTNSYNIEKHTLRFLGTLAKLIDGMNTCATKIEIPILVLHGEKDFLNTDSDVRGFVARIPESTDSTYHNYPGAYHLLMYDEKKEKIFRDVGKWVNRQRSN
jgi:acylglycerol lipase